jgi:hypothetical protein
MFPVPRKAPPISSRGATRWGISTSVFIGIGSSDKALELEAADAILLNALTAPNNPTKRVTFAISLKRLIENTSVKIYN